MSQTTSLAFDELPRGSGGIGAADQMNQVLSESGFDVPVSLYDEALALARDGRLAPATERLRMLLVLDPSDGEAALLLGKVLAARNQWQEALAHLDAAAANGAVLPPGLRDEVVNRLQQQIQDAEEHRNRVAARERGEIRNLRNEAKRLRSDNAQLEVQVEELSRRVRLWSSATALVAGSASALLLASLLFGGTPEAPEPLASETPPPVESAELPPPTAVEGTPGAAVVEASPPAEVVAEPAPAVVAPAPEAETPAKQAPSKTAKVHVVKKGDTLGKIAHQYYGKSSHWPRIRDANRDVIGKNGNLKLGTKLKIPPKK